MLIRDVRETVATVLKQQTAREHQALEEKILPRLQGLQNMNDYAQLLKIFYGYFKPVEDRIGTQLHLKDVPDLQQRRKADWILQDLTFSKSHTEHLRLATHLPQINNSIQAFGALYVLEGSTLGGRGITKMLLKNPVLQLQQTQVRFFNGYGADTGPRWMAFMAFLNQQDTTPAALEQMASSANETFTLFKNWIQEHDA